MHNSRNKRHAAGTLCKYPLYPRLAPGYYMTNTDDADPSAFPRGIVGCTFAMRKSLAVDHVDAMAKQAVLHYPWRRTTKDSAKLPRYRC